MNDFQEKLESLSPRKRELLNEYLAKRGNPSSASPPAVPERAPAIAETKAAKKEAVAVSGGIAADKDLKFSIFFFSDDSSLRMDNKYRFLLELAQLSDEYGFEAIWTPERHFHRFGGLYPNPSVLAAAIAAKTERIQIRAGSILLPFHHPIRVAEDWSIIDNLSRGRAGVAFASGWHPKDFVFAPDSYHSRKDIMFERIEMVKKLWEGKELRLKAGLDQSFEPQIYPLPIQESLPIWVTSSKSQSTWKRAGAIGANVLTALLEMDVETLKENIAVYKAEREKHGHGAEGGKITLMLHTYVGEQIDEVRKTVRGPLIQYLKQHMELFDNDTLASELNLDPQKITMMDREALAAFGFERYFSNSALLGTKETCRQKTDALAAIGVTEIACLIDFGVSEEDVKRSLGLLDELRQSYAEKEQVPSYAGSESV
ncbi:MupA/Atu3671 family FMN-dependent luciferase-like monooxygenase [Paenibacillus sp. GCM10027627]|uniref:MupA/Atu3671 family FMN-dependent luciferase-like monooxygenase n=1 Tax=unclassified Paenibacillus TaxID=185978 RepID=UPI00364179A6